VCVCVRMCHERGKERCTCVCVCVMCAYVCGEESACCHTSTLEVCKYTPIHDMLPQILHIYVGSVQIQATLWLAFWTNLAYSSHIPLSHGTYMNEWVTSHIYISDVQIWALYDWCFHHTPYWVTWYIWMNESRLARTFQVYKCRPLYNWRFRQTNYWFMSQLWMEKSRLTLTFQVCKYRPLYDWHSRPAEHDLPAPSAAKFAK